MKSSKVWVTRDGRFFALKDLDPTHLINILNLIEVGHFKHRLGATIASAADLRWEAKRRGIKAHTPRVWTI